VGFKERERERKEKVITSSRDCICKGTHIETGSTLVGTKGVRMTGQERQKGSEGRIRRGGVC
jgi:hypothetical protein